MKKIFLTAIFAVAVGLLSANAQVDDQDPVNQPPSQTDEDPLFDESEEVPDTAIIEEEPGVLRDTAGTLEDTTETGLQDEYNRNQDNINDPMKNEDMSDEPQGQSPEPETGE